jgi:aromatic ring-opening dioxygenase LigB subunit
MISLIFCIAIFHGDSIMVLVGSFFVPHGSLILKPSEEGISDSAKQIHTAMVRINKKIQNLNPELCFLITPHGISLSNDYGLYTNQTAKGTAEWENEYHNFKAEINLDQDETRKLFKFLVNLSIPVSTITCFAAGVHTPLRWGEVVPLWFLKEIDMKYIIMSIPTRRYNQAKEMIPELMNLGASLFEYFNKSDKRIIALISGDLAHTHSQDGPYRFSEKAEEFDQIIEQWVKTGDKNLLLTGAKNILDEALCCGFPGLIVLQGLLEKSNLSPKFLIRSHPSYYGMLVASFT